jgi:murein L,D-transpeptidase YcbB/YkuD
MTMHPRPRPQGARGRASPLIVAALGIFFPAAAVAQEAPAAPSAGEPVFPPVLAPLTAAETPAAESPAPKPKPKPKPAPPRETALSDDPTPALQPETFFATAKAAERYAAIVDQGGWPRVGVKLNPGAKGPAVLALRRRLAAEDDEAPTTGAVFDAPLAQAVKRFQFRMGLRQTGVVAGVTLQALDVPAEARQRQLAASAQRLSAVQFPYGPRYVVVNIPSTAVDAVDGDRVARRYAAIVGDPEHHSPEVSAKIMAININPTWTVPVSIIKNEIAPKMQRDPKYLSRMHIRVLNHQGEEVDPGRIDWSSDRALSYTLRQDSGAQNSLGSIRISMPNSHAVYMHDTPSRNLFANDYRFLSHGCVRVQGVNELALWLMQDAQGQWDAETLKAKIASGEPEEVRLKNPVPVVWVYMTGWASADGTVHFRDDVYGVDAVDSEVSDVLDSEITQTIPPARASQPSAARP